MSMASVLYGVTMQAGIKRIARFETPGKS